MAESDDRPGYSFADRIPPEASRFLSNKGWMPAFSWLDVEPEEHAVAFTVAKATSMDVLTTIREELQTALDQGRTFQSFQKDLRPRLEALGWWGQASVTDLDTDEDQIVTLGTPRRLRVIYDANLRSARAAGQWDRIQRTKRALPYLTYQLGPSERHRPHHVTKEGLTLPVDDPFWSTWYPPNGWGCKCWVRQVSRREAEELGVDESPEVPLRDWENRRTGEISQVPVGIDPGWQANPGQMRQRTVADLFASRLSNLSRAQHQTAIRDIATSWAINGRAGPDPAIPIAFLPPGVADRLSARSGVVTMDPEMVLHVRGNRERQVFDLAPFAGLQDIDELFSATDEFGRLSLHGILDATDDPGEAAHLRGRVLRFVLHRTEDGFRVATAFLSARRKWERRFRDGEYELVE